VTEQFNQTDRLQLRRRGHLCHRVADGPGSRRSTDTQPAARRLSECVGFPHEGGRRVAALAGSSANQRKGIAAQIDALAYNGTAGSRGVREMNSARTGARPVPDQADVLPRGGLLAHAGHLVSCMAPPADEWDGAPSPAGTRA